MVKRLIAPVVIAGALLGGVATAGTAYASAPAPATATVAANAPATHPLRAWVRKHRRQIRRAGLAVSAEAIGVTPQALATELRSGMSIAQVAAQHNVTAQSVVDALVNAAEARVTKAVSNHELTSAQGSKIDAALPGYVTKVVNHVF